MRIAAAIVACLALGIAVDASAQDQAAPSREEMAAAVTGDAAAGERIFAQCRACHVVDQPTNRVGPSLLGVFGRTSGAVEGFNYSDAMKNAGIVWTPETMAEYLAAPRTYIPGNKMAFVGVRNEEQRANVIAYLFEATQE